jgi:hypothetical protein
MIADVGSELSIEGRTSPGLDRRTVVHILRIANSSICSDLRARPGAVTRGPRRRTGHPYIRCSSVSSRS